MDERKIYEAAPGKDPIRLSDADNSPAVAVAAPVISGGDVLGLVLFIDDGAQKCGPAEYKLAQTIAAFLGRHMED